MSFWFSGGNVVWQFVGGGIFLSLLFLPPPKRMATFLTACRVCVCVNV